MKERRWNIWCILSGALNKYWRLNDICCDVSLSWNLLIYLILQIFLSINQLKIFNRDLRERERETETERDRDRDRHRDRDTERESSVTKIALFWSTFLPTHFVKIPANFKNVLHPSTAPRSTRCYINDCYYSLKYHKNKYH